MPKASADVFDRIGEFGPAPAVADGIGRPAAGTLSGVLDAHREVKPCVDSPSDARASVRILTGGSRQRSCVRPVAAAHDRWPRWSQRSGPKQSSGFESRGFSEFSRSSVRPIVISLSCFTPASTHGGTVSAISLPPFRASSWPMPVRPSRCLVTAEATRRFSRLKLAKIAIADCPQRVGGGAAVQIVRQRLQPGDILDL